MKYLKTINELYSDTYLSAYKKTRSDQNHKRFSFRKAYMKELYKELSQKKKSTKEIIINNISNELVELFRKNNIDVGRYSEKSDIYEYIIIDNIYIPDIIFNIESDMDSVHFVMMLNSSFDDDMIEYDNEFDRENSLNGHLEYLLVHNTEKGINIIKDLDIDTEICEAFCFSIDKSDFDKIEQEAKDIFERYELDGRYNIED